MNLRPRHFQANKKLMTLCVMNIMSRHSLGPKTKYVHDHFRFGLRIRALGFVCCSQDAGQEVVVALTMVRLI